MCVTPEFLIFAERKSLLAVVNFLLGAYGWLRLRPTPPLPIYIGKGRRDVDRPRDVVRTL